MTNLFKSELGKKEILELYDQKLQELDITYKSQYVKTSFGDTHLIISGSPENPPLIIVHGSNGCAPIGLESYPNLSSKFQVFTIDVIGQPNKSAEVQMSMKDNSYGKWMNEIIDSLALENVTLAGFSLGGLIILKTLLHNETNIKEVFLAAPCYIVNGNPFKALFKIFIPMKRYMSNHKIKFVEKFLAALFTERDQFAIDYLSKVFIHFNMDFTPVPTISTKDAQSITTPITLFAAKDDLLFPGIKMIKRAEKIFTSLKKSILLEQSKHVQNRNDNTLIEYSILNPES